MAARGSDRKLFVKLRNLINCTPSYWNTYSEGESAVIYARICILDSGASIIYVGMSIHPIQRDIEHLCASSLVNRPGHVYADTVIPADQICGRHALGPGAWVDIPVHIFHCPVPRHVLLRAEKDWIRALGTVNIIYSRWNTSIVHQHGTRRSRPWQRRLAPEPATNTHAAPMYTSYYWGTQAYPDFVSVMRLLSPTDCPIRVCVFMGRATVTNRTTAKRTYGNTIVTWTGPTGSTTPPIKLRCLPLAAWYDNLLQRPCLGVITILQISTRDTVVARGGLMALTLQIGKHPGLLKSIRKDLTLRQFEGLWQAAGKLPQERAKISARRSLSVGCKAVYGISLAARYTFKFPTCSPVPSRALEKVFRSILARVDTPAMAARILRRTRVVRTRGETVGRILHNWRRLSRSYNPLEPPKCTCDQYPASWRTRTPTSLPVHGHFLILDEMYSGPGEGALRVSHKTPVMQEDSDTHQLLDAAIHGYIQQLPVIVRMQISKIQRRSILHTGTWTCERTPEAWQASPGAVSMAEVKAAKSYLKHAVISEVDKGPGRTCICCPVAHHHLMQLVWPSEPDRCTILQDAPYDILSKDVEAYTAAGWERIARLFGCSGLRPTSTARLAAVYATWKMKAFLTGKLKGRPIAPHTAIPLRYLFNLVATAYAFILIQKRSARVSRMYTCREYATRLEEEFSTLQKQMLGALHVVARIGDLAEMYTNLRHCTILDSVSDNIAEYLATDMRIGGHLLRTPREVSVPRRGAKMATCRQGPAMSEDFVTITVDDILAVSTYAVQHSIVMVGTDVRHYHKGIPMGHQLSCALANGTAASAETHNDVRMAEAGFDPDRNLSLQYVDDANIRVAYSPSGERGWTRDSAVTMADMIQSCYPDPLVMEVEPEGEITYRFLETETCHPDESNTFTVHFNRPCANNGLAYDVAAPGGPVTARRELTTEVATLMRIIRNHTPSTRHMAVWKIVERLTKLSRKVAVPYTRAFVRSVIQRLGTHPEFRVFVETYRDALALVLR